MSQADGEIPANSPAANDPAVQAQAAVAGYAAQVKVGVALPNTPYMSALWTPVQAALTSVWNNSQTPEKALNDAQAAATKAIGQRSEEHTSELQSHLNLVCRLLLEKKNKDR